MSVMKIAGKNPNDEVTGVAVSAGGNVITQKVWKNEVVEIYSQTTPTSGTKYATALDLSDCGAVSLRVDNTTDQDLSLGLYVDYLDNTYQMRDSNGNVIRITIPADTPRIMITPDDIPQLQWIKKLRVYFVLSENTASGTVAIYAVKKA